MTDILHQAFEYIEAGYAVFPVDRQTKKPLVRWSEYQKRLPTKREFERWFKMWPKCNLGLITGYWGNRVVFDFDEKDAFTQWAATTDFPPTLLIGTSRGFHVHFTVAGGAGKSFIAKHPHGDKLEVKALGNFVVVPPSIHASGKPYLVLSAMDDVYSPAAIPSVDSVLGEFRRPVPPQLPLILPPKPTNGRLTKTAAIKATFRIENLVKETEKADGRGRILAKCPIHGHDDTHRSFWFHPVDQVCACSKCTGQGTWDVINLYAAIHGLTNAQAIDELYQLTPQGLKEPR